MDLLEIIPNHGIVAGYPFLMLKKERILVLGDLHIGQESIVLDSSSKTISRSTNKMLNKIRHICDLLDVKSIVFNGDIKHYTLGITNQEIKELEHLNELFSDKEIVFIKGNHDRFLNLASKFSGGKQIKICEFFQVGDTLIFHGDKEKDIPQSVKNLILSHEHPSFVFKGSVGERIKLPAFAFMSNSRIEGRQLNILILPASTGLAGGVSFPPSAINAFLSPLLRRIAPPVKMEIFPFDEDVGILPIPPLVLTQSKH